MPAGAPIGNRNTVKGKRWREALTRALNKRAADAGVHENEILDSLADKLLIAATAGEQWAIKELGDRLDGKPATVIVGDDDAAPVKIDGFVRLVKPSDPVGVS